MKGRIETYQRWIEAEIQKQKFGKAPASLYEPIRYTMSLGGKRLRPMLTLLAYSLFRSDVRRIVPLATAVEIFHNFTLLHDDIMDDAPLRRGKPTVHSLWDVNTAILAGDVMQVKAYDILLGAGSRTLKSIFLAFNKCAVEVCEGQKSDIDFEKRMKVSEKEYLEMIRKKTAVLLGFSLELGAILAGASTREQKALREFGINIGIGFQLRDDLLDVYALTKNFGKQVGGDIVSNKKTFLLIKSLERARGAEGRRLRSWLSRSKFNKREKVTAVTAIYDRLRVRNLTERKIDEFFSKGFRQLTAVRSGKKGNLIHFADSLITRQS